MLIRVVFCLRRGGYCHTRMEEEEVRTVIDAWSKGSRYLVCQTGLFGVDLSEVAGIYTTADEIHPTDKAMEEFIRSLIKKEKTE